MLDKVSWPKAALLGGVVLLIVGIFHRPTADWFIEKVTVVIRIIANAAGGAL